MENKDKIILDLCGGTEWPRPNKGVKMKVSKYKNKIVMGIKTYGSAVCKTGNVNSYRVAFLQGLGASSKEKTYRKRYKGSPRGGHICCGSRVGWRHKVTCKNALRNLPDDYSDLKDPDLI